ADWHTADGDLALCQTPGRCFVRLVRPLLYSTIILLGASVPSAKADLIIGNLVPPANADALISFPLNAGVNGDAGFTMGLQSFSLDTVKVRLTSGVQNQPASAVAPVLTLFSNVANAPGVPLQTFSAPTASGLVEQLAGQFNAFDYTFAPTSP